MGRLGGAPGTSPPNGSRPKAFGDERFGGTRARGTRRARRRCGIADSCACGQCRRAYVAALRVRRRIRRRPPAPRIRRGGHVHKTDAARRLGCRAASTGQEAAAPAPHPPDRLGSATRESLVRRSSACHGRNTVNIAAMASTTTTPSRSQRRLHGTSAVSGVTAVSFAFTMRAGGRPPSFLFFAISQQPKARW